MAAVKKSAAEAAESERAAVADVSAIGAENAAGGAQDAPQTEEDGQEAERLVYIGPSLPKGMLKSNRVIYGTRKEIRKELAEALEKFPLAEKMLVPVEELAEKKDKARTAGNILNKYYSDIASAAYAMEREV